MEPSTLLPKPASAERAEPEALTRQSKIFLQSENLRAVFDSVPAVLMILNTQRQILYTNPALLSLVHESQDKIIGLRPGELLRCVHAKESTGGCGTTQACRACGALHAILSGLSGKPLRTECRMTVSNNDQIENLDLAVAATPFSHEGEPFTVVYMTDISDQKRRRTLERLFFHDVLNTAGNVVGYNDLLADAQIDPSHQKFLAKARRAAERLVEQVRSQRALTDAENNELQVSLENIHLPEFLKGLTEDYQGHPLAHGITLAIETPVPDLTLRTDPVLLGRVIGNMLKNAFEASTPGQSVTIGAKRSPPGIEIWVHNAAGMPEEAQLQIFQRSYSTKGSGRGLGTYSIRLLSERYLGGHASFISSDSLGTTFRVNLPC